MATFGEDQVVAWIEESKVSESLVLEFERSTGVLTEAKYGMINHTVVKSSYTDNSAEDPPKKKKKSQCWNVGYCILYL